VTRRPKADPHPAGHPNESANDQPAPGWATPTSSSPPTIARAPGSYDQVVDKLGHQLRRNADADALVTGHVAVLGLGTASERLMVEAKSRADAGGVVLNFHRSYSPADTEADRRQYGTDSLLHLAEIGCLDDNVTLAHANHLTDEECDAVLRHGTSIAWAPAASMMWGHGGCLHGRHAELWRRGANVALGSDSPNWSNSFDVFRQASLAMLTARDAHQDRTYLVAEDGLLMATRGGAKATGMDTQIGSLAAGKRADIVVHALRRAEPLPVTDMVRNLMYASGSKSVHTVVMNGKVILDGGEFPRLDEARPVRCRRASHSLLARMGKTVEPNQLGPRRDGVPTS